jgi:RNA polymerase sigma factor (sigma-70 family)
MSMLEEQYPSVDLAARRDVPWDDISETDQPSILLDQLTDRQREVLRTAYYAGFFETPRKTSADGIAEMLEVSQPTVSRHLRRGQQRLLTGLFDRRTNAE